MFEKPKDDGYLIHPDDIKIKQYIKGSAGCEITAYELKLFGLLLDNLSRESLSKECEFLLSLNFGSYKRMHQRHDSGDSQIKALEKMYAKLLKKAMKSVSDLYEQTGQDDLLKILQEVNSELQQ